MLSSNAQAGKFVISLCSVAVPIAIPQPRSPELMRYRFFLHTSWEEGGRRHQLYMGYFAARNEAEKWLATLRRIYPSAFIVAAPAAMTLSNTQIVSLLEQPTSVSMPASVSVPGAAAVSEAPSARPGLQAGETTGARPALRSSETTGARPTLRSSETTGARPALRSSETTGARPALRSSETTGARPALRSSETTGARPALRSNETTGARPGLQAREATGSRPALRGHEDRDRGRSPGPSLEDTIAALKVSALDFNEGADPLSSTGVRHLRIEVQKEAPRPRGEKRSGARKP